MIFLNNVLYNCLMGKKQADSSQDELYRSIVNGTCSLVTIPDGTTSIRDNVFSNCTSLEKVIIPSSVETISSSAFSGCSALTDIYINKDEDSISGANWGATNATIHWNSTGPNINLEPEVEQIVIPAYLYIQFTNNNNATWADVGGLPKITFTPTDENKLALSDITYPESSDLINNSRISIAFPQGTEVNWEIDSGWNADKYSRTSGTTVLSTSETVETVEITFTVIEF